MAFTKDMGLISKTNNAGMVATTAGATGDLMHTTPTNRSVKIKKIIVYNNTGGDATVDFGSLNNLGAYVALLPALLCINGIDNIWTEEEIPNLEFAVDATVGAGSDGNIYVNGSVAGMNVLLEVEEKA